MTLEMPYGTFSYRFERQRIVDPYRVGVVRDVGYDRLVLTACHPLSSAAQRIVVFARLTSVDSNRDESGESQGGRDNSGGVEALPTEPASAAAVAPPGLGPTWADSVAWS
jgi:hypothetical protein